MPLLQVLPCAHAVYLFSNRTYVHLRTMPKGVCRARGRAHQQVGVVAPPAIVCRMVCGLHVG